jgi:hypothetical protein
MGRKWIDEEISFIKDNASSLTNKELAIKLSRSESAIKNFVHTLSLPNRQNKWSAEKDEKLRIIYRGKLDPEILEQFPNRTRLSIHTRAVRLNLTEQCLWTEEEKRLLTSVYRDLPTGDLTHLFTNRTKGAIVARSQILHVSLPRGEKQRYSLDDTFFDTPNIKNCYYAGLLAADGNVYKNRIKISLQRLDRTYLEKFAHALSYKGNLKDSERIKKTGTHIKLTTLVFTSKNIVQKLGSIFNIVPNKTFILEPPHLEDTALIKCFIVGLIDGDGSVGVTSDNRARLSLYGCERMLTWVKLIFDKLYPSPTRYTARVNKSPRSNSYVYDVSGKRATMIIDDLKTLDIPKFQRKWR